MLAVFCGAWWPYLLAFLIGLATAYWAWARSASVAVATPEVKIAPEPVVKAAPVAAAAAVAAVPLMAAAVKPKAAPKPKPAPVKKAAVKVAAPKAVVKPVATPKVVAPKAKVAVPKAKPAPAPKVAAPKAKVEAVKVKAAPKPKAAPVKVAALPAAKPKVKAAAKPVVVAKPKVAAKPKAAPKPKPAPKPRIPDNLELLKGVGPKLNDLLKSLGVTTFEQVANWTARDVREIDSKLGNFAGRIGRDNWIDQAKLLVKGDVAGFEKKYGTLGSEISKG